MKKRATTRSKAKASMDVLEIVIRPKVRNGVDHNLAHDRDANVGFYVMPPPTISGLDELWRVADAGWQWTHIASLLQNVPKAGGMHGVLTMLNIDLSQCFELLESVLRTGAIPEIADFRDDMADEVIDVAQQILEMEASGELSELGHCDDCGADALALLASAREALAISGSHEDTNGREVAAP